MKHALHASKFVLLDNKVLHDENQNSHIRLVTQDET